MEFPFNVNNLVGNEITLVDKDLVPFRTSPATLSEYKVQLCRVIDKLGEASAKAQGLHGPITSSSRVAYSDQHLYIMKDVQADTGNGAAVGLLKVGHKRLFVYDHHGVQHEMEPLCLLDFYVHESMQRSGCGKKLFEYMLREESLRVQHLAIDRPSHKCLCFLKRHYGLKATIQQVNNFVVFEGFFRDRPNLDRRKQGSSKPPLHPYKRQGSGNRAAANGDLPGDRPSRLSSRPGPGRKSDLEVEGSDGQPAAGERAVGRESAASCLSWRDSSAADEDIVAPLAPPESFQQVSVSAATRGTASDPLPRKFASLSLLEALPDPQKEGLYNGPLTRNDSRNVVSTRAKDGGGGQNMPSPLDGNTALPPIGGDSNLGSSGARSVAAHNSSQYSRHITIPTTPPAGRHAGSSPQLTGGMLRRDGPSSEYLQLVNADLHNPSCYQDRRGRLKVSPLSGESSFSPTGGNVSATDNAQQWAQSRLRDNRAGAVAQIRTANAASAPAAIAANGTRGLPTSAWNVFGVPPNPKATSAASHHHSTRLW